MSRNILSINFFLTQVVGESVKIFRNYL